MPELTEPLRELVRKWREEAQFVNNQAPDDRLHDSRFETLTACRSELESLIAPIEKGIDALKDDELAKKFTYCAYCGHTEPIDTDGEIIAQHIRTCEKHPLNIQIAALTTLVNAPTFSYEEWRTKVGQGATPVRERETYEAGYRAACVQQEQAVRLAVAAFSVDQGIPGAVSESDLDVLDAHDAEVRDRALEEAAHSWDTHTIPSTFHDIYVAIQNHILAKRGSKP